MKILIDLRTGEPVFDVNGNLQECNIAREFNQYMDVMLHTPLFSEYALPTWGIPIKEIMQLSFNVNWENMVKYFITQSLNSRWEPLIRDIVAIDVERNGSAIDINLHVTSKYGTETEVELNLYE